MKHSFIYMSALALLVCSCNYEETKKDHSTPATPAVDKAQMDIDKGITAQLRQAIIDESSISIPAKGIKITTIRGVVNLKGAVESIEEKQRIEKLAKGIPNVQIVENQLEIVVPNKKLGSQKP